MQMAVAYGVASERRGCGVAAGGGGWRLDRGGLAAFFVAGDEGLERGLKGG